MAPVNIKYIVSFSSQDDNHKANNLMDSDGTKCWLSHPKDRSGKLEVILQLDRASQLAYVDIGTQWCASLEIRVGCSDWPQSMEYKPLVPSINLMSPMDCLLNRATSCTKMFTKADFSKEIICQKWDRLQLICRQPFRKDMQFGVSFVRIKSIDLPEEEPCTNDKGSDVQPEVKKTHDIDSIFKKLCGNKESSGSDMDSPNPKEMLKQRLMKISGSSENGSDHEHALSRTAKLVLKATESSPKHPLALAQPNKGLFSAHLAKKNEVPFETDVSSFLSTLRISHQDLDTVTIADLRHKFEKRKRRKLTTEEKKIFSAMFQNFICDLFEPQENAANESKPPVLDDPGHSPRCKQNFQTLRKNVASPSTQRLKQSSASHGSENELKDSHKTPPNNKRLRCVEKYNDSFSSSTKKRRSGDADINEVISGDDEGVVDTSSGKSLDINKSKFKKIVKHKNELYKSNPSFCDVEEDVNFNLNFNNSLFEDDLDKSCDRTIETVYLSSSDNDNDQPAHVEDTTVKQHRKRSNKCVKMPPVSGKMRNSRGKTKSNDVKDGSTNVSTDNIHKPFGKTFKGVRAVTSQRQLKLNESKLVSTSKIADTSGVITNQNIKSTWSSRKGKGQNRKSSAVISESDTTICDKCFAVYPSHDIGTHQVFCSPPSAEYRNANSFTNEEFLLDDRVDYLECPICLERYPQDILPVHASECGL
ncbi:uncharacterized protein LOC106068386 [Biomphalaria glabrata]|uniref:Uncharacterized protein LOC106068386 n=1 Tax=Biomphalaria glabrata TaxID=6526 RepID=A0A9U8ED51_BIOGL|nr:uncharacterized protein LOC106068386 [Biomphalaria glabrata]